MVLSVPVNRRIFLGLMCSTAITPARAVVRGGYTTNVSAVIFQGNPNVTISAINATGGITLSRSSGQIPAFVQVSANAITATGTSAPYEDLQYNWDFGDPTGTETFTNPYTGLTENANNAQTGPEASYVYRNVGAGFYTIKLTITGMNGSTPVSTTTTTTFSTSAFTPTTAMWFDSVGGSDSNNGTSPATPKQTSTAILAAVSAISNNTQINLKCGSSWSSATGINIGSKTLSHLRFQSYGSGAAPIFTVTGSTGAFETDNGGASSPHAQTDTVVSGISFQTASGYTGASGRLVGVNAAGNTSAVIDNLYFDNCIISQNLATTSSTNNVVDIATDPGFPDTLNAIGLWNCAVSGPSGTSSNTRQGTFFNMRQFAFVVGCTYSGNGTSTTLDHHIYPLLQNHALFRYNTFNAATGKNFALNCDWNSVSGGNEAANYWLISDNLVSGPQLFHDASDGNNDQLVLFSNFVVQRNRVNLPNATVGALMSFTGGQSMTWRYNQFWNNNTCLWNPDGVANALYKFYFNYIYVPATAVAGTAVFDLWNGGVPTYTSKFVITDNQVQDQRSNSITWNLGFANQSGATIDRNDTYTPNDTTSFGDQGTGKTFSQWQAAGFDPNGLNTNPGFINGAVGQFH